MLFFGTMVEKTVLNVVEEWRKSAAKKRRQLNCTGEIQLVLI